MSETSYSHPFFFQLTGEMMYVPIFKNGSSQYSIWGIIFYPERKAESGKHMRTNLFYEQVGQCKRKKRFFLSAAYFSWIKVRVFYPDVLFWCLGKRRGNSFSKCIFILTRILWQCYSVQEFLHNILKVNKVLPSSIHI